MWNILKSSCGELWRLSTITYRKCSFCVLQNVPSLLHFFSDVLSELLQNLFRQILNFFSDHSALTHFTMEDSSGKGIFWKENVIKTELECRVYCRCPCLLPAAGFLATMMVVSRRMWRRDALWIEFFSRIFFFTACLKLLNEAPAKASFSRKTLLVFFLSWFRSWLDLPKVLEIIFRQQPRQMSKRYSSWRQKRHSTRSITSCLYCHGNERTCYSRRGSGNQHQSENTQTWVAQEVVLEIVFPLEKTCRFPCPVRNGVWTGHTDSWNVEPTRSTFVAERKKELLIDLDLRCKFWSSVPPICQLGHRRPV